MQRGTLKRWLVRMASKGAERAELVHVGAEDQRIVEVFELDDAANPRLDEVCAELLATAQDETDILDQRATFTVRVLAGEGDESRTLGSTRIRCEVRAEARTDDDDKEIDTSKEGVVAMLAGQAKFAFRELGAAPQRQRLVYEHLLDVQDKIIMELRRENAELYKMIKKFGDATAVETELREADEKRNALIGTVISELKDVGLAIVGAKMGQVNGAAKAGTA